MRRLEYSRSYWLTLNARRSWKLKIARSRKTHRNSSREELSNKKDRNNYRIPDAPLQKHRVELTVNGRTYTKWARRAGRRMPANFCLTDNYVEVCKFLEVIRSDMFLSNARRVSPAKAQRWRMCENYADFKTLERITPTAALVLAAEFDRARQFLTHRPLPAIDLSRWHPDVRSVLRDVGFLSLFGIEEATPQDQTGPKIVRFTTGDMLDSEKAGKLTEILQEMISGAGLREQLAELMMYDGIVEAMENARAHAYPDSFIKESQYPVAPRWWLTGAVDPANNSLTVSIYDQGASIPLTLPSWHGWGWARRYLERAKRLAFGANDLSFDGEAVRAAMVAAATSTQLKHRGKGLPLIKLVIDRCRYGRLRIISRCGDYQYEKGHRVKTRTWNHSIGGTLVEWEIAL